MNNILSNIMFGFGTGPNGTPALYLFGFPIYLYALIIVTGMSLAILIGAMYFKKRGYDPYDITIYAIAIIPLGVLGCRLYVYIFPWAGQSADWSTFFNFRSGGLGIYGGVILGYLAGYVICKIRKQNFAIVAESIIPGLLLAQSIGRWGNFVNQEAHGDLIANEAMHWFPFGVEIGGDWYYATFFYESMATLIGFLICVLVLTRHKNYKLGWITAFYGIYYGIARLLIEGMRTDSLYLWIGSNQTDIRISQLVSVFTIILGIYTLTKIYRQQLHKLYSRMFVNERQEVSTSRFVLVGVAVVAAAIGTVMFCLGGESKFIIGTAMTLIALYSVLGIFSLNNRLQLYCGQCNTRLSITLSPEQQDKVMSINCCYRIILAVSLSVLGIVLIILGAGADVIPNQIVLGIICCLASIPLYIYIVKSYKKNGAKIFRCLDRINSTSSQCQCGKGDEIRLNLWLLAIFPFKVYKDYGVSHLTPYVDPEVQKRREKRLSQGK